MRQPDDIPLHLIVARTGRRWRWTLQLPKSGLTVDRGVADTLDDCKEAARRLGWEPA